MKRVFRIGLGAAVGTGFAVVMLNGCVGGDPVATASSSNGDSGSSTADGSGTTTTNDSGVPDLDPDAAPLALCPLGCLPPAPPGWAGPSATYDGAESGKPTDCPTPYTQKVVEAHVGMTAAPATCACGAPTVTGRRCTATIGTYNDASCTSPSFAEPAASSTGGCVQTLTGKGAYYRVDAPKIVNGTCTFPAATKDVPAPSFQRVQVSCGLPQAAACDTRPDCVASPVPAQPFTRLCIHKDGDEACPSQDYAVKFIAFKQLDDKRTCTACTATATGGACGTTWGEAADQTQCTSGAAANGRTAGTCYNYGGIGTLVDIRAMGPSAATCTPSGGQPDQTATSIQPVTYCCNR